VSDSAYFVGPLDAPGPGVLLLHSWWGLTGGVRLTADRLADEGFTVLAPDLNDGATFEDREAARRHLEEADPNRLARVTLDSLAVLAERSPGGSVGVVGYSMGASLGMWVSVRRPEAVAAVVAFYGTQIIDFTGSRSAYQIHAAGVDDLVGDDELSFMEATIGLEGLELEVFRYPGAGHWFAEQGAAAYDPEAAGRAWDRAVGFLRHRLAAGG
jgi:carboxymethylenebutenolidase